MNKQLPAGYAELRPIADYAPWDTDRSFLTAYNRIKDNTLVDIYRCYSLWQLALQLRHLEGDVLEVGVWRGGTGALLTQALRDDPTCTIYLADTFRGVVKAGPRDDYYKGGEHANTSRETVEQLIAAVGGERVRILEGIFPDETGTGIDASRLRMCHIDVDVYQSALDVLEWVWPRLAVGGVVVFDDYGFFGCEGVTALGNELLARAQKAPVDYIFTYNLNGQGVMLKKASKNF
ncbi:TylF/MycF/NovP-related O-methyltransferase [Spirochaeta africana]|uniref:Putative O-methyltransferase n=1 Tax=Spirochaeta africana (strain ATCC 700263 / DSM 8902 / Z-7692) TaxID=889378 RepID=H9UMC8_SPIAZ|nr:TylF/MycF/NovP-related O-methyltransferase [Spirochaeta africana]AFG38671.1 putative O-methyltransferase [Spirochaeta africana DSM 8902]